MNFTNDDKNKINNHETEIKIMKEYITIFDREIMNLRKQGRANTVLLITELLCIIGFLMQKIL